MYGVVARQNRPGCLIQLLWFVLVGWWVGQLWIAVAWFLAATVIGIPLAVMMFNKLPDIIALRGSDTYTVTWYGNRAVVHDTPQHNILVRVLWYVLVGWWLAGVWIELAYVLCLSVIGLPVGFWMFDRVPAVLSLRR
ncbi:MAG: YccF domain-containing protein [Chloroflexi bacterium]|nr:YccF domain-containing protein [Chloroflexota bacterium]MCL5275704.1 YccF domain-containing protein [Chloroflexota bacterium]